MASEALMKYRPLCLRSFGRLSEVVVGGMIVLKSAQEVEKMRQAGRIVAEALALLAEHVKPGVTTGQLDTLAHDVIVKAKALPSFKGYHGYPASICTSVNEEIVHGIPGPRVLKEGDIVSIDVGSIYKGYQGDAAITVAVGEISEEAKRLLEVTRGALNAAIAQVKCGNRLGDISWAIQSYAERHRFSVVREYTGHGIGRKMHEDPQIYNYGQPGQGIPLKSGMTFALEPMVNIGDWRTKVLGNNWTVVTLDGSLSAHFEHTVAVMDGEPAILTQL
jgi:methionyl aminopeptidase